MRNKSNHKHEYTQCLLELQTDRKSIVIGKRCIVCGRTKIENMFPSEQNLDGSYTLLNKESIINKYSELSLYKYTWNTKYT